jgi:hypothetical protein
MNRLTEAELIEIEQRARVLMQTGSVGTLPHFIQRHLSEVAQEAVSDWFNRFQPEAAADDIKRLVAQARQDTSDREELILTVGAQAQDIQDLQSQIIGTKPKKKKAKTA